jgi:hypothetical protein
MGQHAQRDVNRVPGSDRRTSPVRYATRVVSPASSARARPTTSRTTERKLTLKSVVGARASFDKGRYRILRIWSSVQFTNKTESAAARVLDIRDVQRCYGSAWGVLMGRDWRA